MTALEQRVGYRFRNAQLLEQALTHSSSANERKSSDSNERLEFLGDSVLGYLTARFLYETFPRLPEGELTRRRAAIVCEASLAKAARELGLGEAIRLGQGENNAQGRDRPSILSDAFEALLAAVTLDGGLDRADELLRRTLLRGDIPFAPAPEDYKTALQERVQRVPGRSLQYRVVSEEGPPHEKMFHVELFLDGQVAGRGSAGSKKKAEQLAAREALGQITDNR